MSPALPDLDAPDDTPAVQALFASLKAALPELEKLSTGAKNDATTFTTCGSESAVSTRDRARNADHCKPFVGFSANVCFDASRLKDHSVILDVSGTNVAEHLSKAVKIGRAGTKQVQILSSPVRVFRPNREEHGAFQDELPSVGRFA